MSPIIVTFPIYFVVFIVGIGIGAILPDVDGSISPYEYQSDAMRTFGIATKRAYNTTAWVFKSVKPNYNRKLNTHRGILHSIPGTLLCISIVIIPINLIIYFLGLWSLPVLVASGGIYVGAFLHLLEDCCTWTGVRLFAPFKDVRLYGEINTCASRREENRPQTYGKIFASIGVVCMCFFALRNFPIFGSVAFINDLSPFILIIITTIMSFLTWYIIFRYSGGKVETNS
jgi:membrane-bound metal-dependent hydrolase YbcI (DUF457 family)